MTFSAHVASQHVARLDPIFSFFNSLVSIYFQFYFEDINPRFTKLCHQMLNLAVGSNFHLVHPCQPQQRLILCTHQLSTHAKEVYFCSFVTKSNNPIQHAPNVHPHVFNIAVSIGPSYTLIIHRESHGFLHVPPPLTVFPHISPQNLFYSLPIISLLESSKKLKRKFLTSLLGKRSIRLANHQTADAHADS